MTRRRRSPSVTIHVNPERPIEPLLEDTVISAAVEVLAREWGKAAEVSITFDGDGLLKALNRNYLGKDSSTDVIAFNLSGESDFLIGDIYISVDRAEEQARRYDILLEEELLRLELHGVLHLLGYDHETDDGEMWERQEFWLGRLTGGSQPCR
jgi:probable rRNA maturation factor